MINELLLKKIITILTALIALYNQQIVATKSEVVLGGIGGVGGGTTTITLIPKQIPKEISDKYSLMNNSFERLEKSDAKDRIKVEIGDKNQPQFIPKIKLQRWDEVDFSLTPIENETDNPSLSFKGNKIDWKKGNLEIEYFDAPTSTNEGGYKMVWYLNSKPATNKLEFSIQSKGLDFFYQASLNVENKDPNLTCTETQCKNASGTIVMERPIDVVDSYAVYYSTKGGMNDINGKDYKTGKAFHIYRPHIIDALGAETWGILNIQNGIYSVEIPQAFLDTAVYPIKSNDTFGYTTRGASTSVFDGNLIACSFTGAAGNGTSLTISAMVANYSTPTNKIKGAVYDASNNLVTNGTSNEKTDLTGTVGDWTLNFASPISPTFTAQTYWLAANGDAAGFPFGEGTQYYYDSGTANQAKYISNAYTSFPPATLSGGTNQNNKYSIYATYTPSGGGGTVAKKRQPVIISD